MDELGNQDSTCHQQRHWLNCNYGNTLARKAIKYISLYERKKSLEVAFNQEPDFRRRILPEKNRNSVLTTEMYPRFRFLR